MSLQTGGSQALDEAGTWAYATAASGTVVVPGRVVGITVVSGSSPATAIINGGPTLMIPASSSMSVQPRGILKNPTIVFDSTTMYFVEYLTGG